MLWRPGSAIREIAGDAPFAFAAATAWIAGVFYLLAVESLAVLAQSARVSAASLPASDESAGTVWLALLPGALSRSLMIVLFVSLAYVPLVILIANLFERRDRYSMVFRYNFASIASCALSALAMSLLVALLPAVVISWQSIRLAPNSLVGYFILLALMPLPVFAVYMTLALRAVFGVGRLVASATTLVSFLSLLALPIVIQVFNFVCASPFILLLLFLLLRDRIGGVFDAQKARQAFLGAKGFDDCRYAGSIGAESEIAESTLGAVESRWRFARNGGDLQGGEVQVSADGGPCDLTFAGIRKDQSGRVWPAKWTASVDGKIGVVFEVDRIEVAK
jgi:hypothetical protein